MPAFHGDAQPSSVRDEMLWMLMKKGLSDRVRDGMANDA